MLIQKTKDLLKKYHNDEAVVDAIVSAKDTDVGFGLQTCTSFYIP
jgi:hypothetical protein